MSSLADLIQEKGIHGKVIVSAELGISHNGDPALAKRMIEAAANAGCQAVKVQNYRTGDMVRSRREAIRVDGRDWNAWDLFTRCELDLETLEALYGHAVSCGLIFHSTPTNEEGMRDLRTLGIPIVKLASDVACIADKREAARKYFSTSVIASDGCIDAETAREQPDWLWLHCVREYPASHEDLPGIDRLRMAGIPLVGYSDHTKGTWACKSAVWDHDACWLECHVTLDHTLSGPDHRWSKDFTEMEELVKCLTRE